MADYTFDSANYPSVRAAIGLDVDETTLPDETLDLSIYKGETERWIMRSLSEAQWSDSANADTIGYAAAMYLASLAAPRLRVVISERLAGGNLTYANVDLLAVSRELLKKASEAIAEIQNASGAPSPSANPNFFGKVQRRLTY